MGDANRGVRYVALAETVVRLVLVVALLVAGLVAVRLGGVTLTSSRARPAVPQSLAKKSSVRIGLFVPTTGAPAYPWRIAAAEAAVADVNRTEGIKNHSVFLDVCNDGNTAAGAVACANHFVSDQVIATAGGITNYGSAYTRILGAAGIPEVGEHPGSEVEYRAANMFDLDPGDVGSIWGDALFLHHLSKHRIVVVTSASNVDDTTAADFGISKAHLKLVKQITVPAGATDLASYEATAASASPQAVVVLLGEQQAVAFGQAVKAAHQTFLLAVPEGLLGTSDYQHIGLPDNRIITAAPVPPISATVPYPALLNFKSDMALEHKAGGQWAGYADNYSAASILTWLSIIAIAKVANIGHGDPVKASGITADFKASPYIQLNLVLWKPSKHPAKEPTLPMFSIPRFSNPNEYYLAVRQNKAGQDVEVLYRPNEKPVDTATGVGLTASTAKNTNRAPVSADGA